MDINIEDQILERYLSSFFIILTYFILNEKKIFILLIQIFFYNWNPGNAVPLWGFKMSNKKWIVPDEPKINEELFTTYY